MASGGTARTEWMAAPMPGLPVGPQLLDPLDPSADGAVAEAQLRALQRGVEAALEVAGVEQGQPDARGRRPPPSGPVPSRWDPGRGRRPGWWCR